MVGFLEKPQGRACSKLEAQDKPAALQKAEGPTEAQVSAKLKSWDRSAQGKTCQALDGCDSCFCHLLGLYVTAVQTCLAKMGRLWQRKTDVQQSQIQPSFVLHSHWGALIPNVTDSMKAGFQN